jgi:hypothetical protein
MNRKTGSRSLRPASIARGRTIRSPAAVRGADAQGNDREAREPTGSGAIAPRLREHGVHLVPQVAPPLPLLLGQLVQGFGVADAGQVGVALPEYELLANHLAVRVGAGIGLSGPERQVGPEPVEGLGAELDSGPVVGGRFVLAPARSRPGRRSTRPRSGLRT